MSTSPSLIRVLTVDDHALLREGIADLVVEARSQAHCKHVSYSSLVRTKTTKTLETPK